MIRRTLTYIYIYKYRVAANVKEYHIICIKINLFKNHPSKIHDDKAIILCSNVRKIASKKSMGAARFFSFTLSTPMHFLKSYKRLLFHIHNAFWIIPLALKESNSDEPARTRRLWQLLKAILNDFIFYISNVFCLVFWHLF